MANDCIPYFTPGESLTARVGAAAVTGKRLVRCSATVGADGLPVVQHAAAAGKALGVSGQDAAIGATVLVYTTPGIIVPVTAGASITAGQELESNASGQVIPFSAGIKVGYALADAANTADCMVKLY